MTRWFGFAWYVIDQNLNELKMKTFSEIFWTVWIAITDAPLEVLSVGRSFLFSSSHLLRRKRILWEWYTNDKLLDKSAWHFWGKFLVISVPRGSRSLPFRGTTFSILSHRHYHRSVGILANVGVTVYSFFYLDNFDFNHIFECCFAGEAFSNPCLARFKLWTVTECARVYVYMYFRVLTYVIFVRYLSKVSTPLSPKNKHLSTFI